MTDEPKPRRTIAAIAPLEMQEYLMAATIANETEAQLIDGPERFNQEQLIQRIRGAMRLLRFSTFNWLMMNGCALPADLIHDEVHRPVGRQFPDEPIP